ncbi:hypothetical protein TanjilG_29953 [Lupinus angustifolius]|uniref:Dof zinc finger protein n=1 Tax=Lupinus angustifolius TaxID=3871 RepID=A0A1J7H1T0_LUPAN|nr:PREDICTED: dof zinc finger protein DOF3.1-like [Lupinus angustifolius]OIW06532.1 hypothetical protein TanjilG_29953 [Lupinus angustifolius]
MEHERNGERNMNNQQTHDYQLIRQGGVPQQQVQPQKPQRTQQCPRCESLNTRFCYYNNYNLTQPRYFCKECRRYWTQGGTLRNIPIGGSCRKRKHAKNSSNSHAQQPQPLTLTPIVVSSINPFHEGAHNGYLSSMATMRPSQSYPFAQSSRLGVDVVGSSSSYSSNLGFSSNFIVDSLPSQNQIQPSHFYQMGNTERDIASLYMRQGLVIPTNMSNSNNINATSHNDLTQSFTNNANNSNINCTTSSIGSSPLIQNQWSDFLGFGPLL